MVTLDWLVVQVEWEDVWRYALVECGCISHQEKVWLMEMVKPE